MSRLAYFVRETLISLRRNLLMTIAGIITVAISLFLFGGILLVSAVVDHGTQQWKHGIELEIFMKVGASADRGRTRSRPRSSTIRSVKSVQAPEPGGRVRHLQEGLQRPARARRVDEGRATCRSRSGSRPKQGGADTAVIATASTRTGPTSTPSSRPRSRSRACSTATTLDPARLHRDGERAARVVAVPHREHDPPRHVRAPPRDRSDEARRRVELVRACSVHGRGLGPGCDRRGLRLRARLAAQDRHREPAGPPLSRTCSPRSGSPRPTRSVSGS